MKRLKLENLDFEVELPNGEIKKLDPITTFTIILNLGIDISKPKLEDYKIIKEKIGLNDISDTQLMMVMNALAEYNEELAKKKDILS